jgi:hypothetical protein
MCCEYYLRISSQKTTHQLASSLQTFHLIPIKMHTSAIVNDYQLLGEYINT